MAAREFLGLGLTALESNLTALAKPYKLNYAVTYRCNSRCRTCNIWLQTPKDELTLEEVRKFAKKNDSFRWLSLTGGEPFLRSDLLGIVGAFKENFPGLYLLTIPTNSLCSLDKEVAQIEEMLEMGIPAIAITVSLDGNREFHDKVRGVPGNYDKAISLFKRLSELRKTHPNLSPVFGYTISRINQGHFQETFESVKREIPGITHNDFHINLAQLSDNYYRNSGEAILADKQVALNELAYLFRNMRRGSLMSRVEYAFIRGLIGFAKTGKPPMRGKGLDASLFLDSVGNVYPSIMWNRKIANLREIDYDLGRVWHGREANEIRKTIREGKDPANWTSCEAYQSIVGNVMSVLV
jgi:Fe-coproporphyrin III synthase